jgi:hypothetical protein
VGLTAVSLVQATFLLCGELVDLAFQSPDRDLQVLGLVLLGCDRFD